VSLWSEWAETHDLLRQGHLWRPNPQEGACRGCGMEVLWVTTEKGKSMPLDPEPDPRGRFCFLGEVDDMDRKVVHYLKSNESYQDKVMFASHFATCEARKPEKPVEPVDEFKRFM
jgi:hypothetical protein